jgi:hypothetical protein
VRAIVAVLVAALLAPWASGLAATQDRSQSSCAAALVRFEPNKRAGDGVPWIRVGPTRARLEASLYSYDLYVGAARVNRSERLVVRAGIPEKISWFSHKWGGQVLRLSGRRLDGAGAFRQTFRAAYRASSYPSGLRVPASGCWELTLRTKGWLRRVVVEAIDPPAKGACEPTPVRGTDVRAMPARSKLAGAWSWATPEGGAFLHAGGRTPDGGNTKVLWRTLGGASGQLVLRGTQLDGNGSFGQIHPEAIPSGHWPSIPVVPSPGCWRFTVRIAGAKPSAAGILVVRVE